MDPTHNNEIGERRRLFETGRLADWFEGKHGKPSSSHTMIP